MAKKAGGKIFVNGLWLDIGTLKPYAMEECEINHVIDLLRETGEIARAGDKYPTYNEPNDYGYSRNVVDSPLTHMQGLVRYQIDINKEFIEAGVNHVDLTTTSDFLHGSLEKEALEYQNSTKAMFLFYFLEQLVRLSIYPELIDERELDLFSQNFRGFSLLTENQVNASIKKQDIVFNELAYTVWDQAGRKENFSAQQFWDRVTSRINEKGGEIEGFIHQD